MTRLALALTALVLWSCASVEFMRDVTYGPDFHFITRDEITDTMTGLAYWIAQLEDLMWQEEELGPGDQQRVVEILTEMQRLTDGLHRGTRSNHMRIDRNARWLQDDVRRALHAARRTPPNYFFAGEVAGACEYCHPPRHETVRERGPELPSRGLD